MKGCGLGMRVALAYRNHCLYFLPQDTAMDAIVTAVTGEILTIISAA